MNIELSSRRYSKNIERAIAMLELEIDEESIDEETSMEITQVTSETLKEPVVP